MFKRSILLLICAVYFAAAATNMTTYNYKVVNGTNVQLNVYTPPTAAPATGYPVFFAIHGGGLYSGAKTGAFSSQELAEVMSRGWVLVSIDYRLMPSVFLEDIVVDMKDAYAWVRTELPKKTPININPFTACSRDRTNKITVFGQSAGGGLATMSGYLFSPRPKAIIGMYPGWSNWTDPALYWPGTAVNPTVVELANNLSTPLHTRYTISGSSDQRLRLWTLATGNRKWGWLAVTHNASLSTATIWAKLKSLSSSENVDANYPPTYLAHGLVDTTVYYNQSVMLANSLAKKNITHVLNLVPGANHNFDGSATYWNDYVYPAFEFAQQYM